MRDGRNIYSQDEVNILIEDAKKEVIQYIIDNLRLQVSRDNKNLQLVINNTDRDIYNYQDPDDFLLNEVNIAKMIHAKGD